MGLIDDLEQWNGKSTEEIQAIARCYSSDTNFIEAVTEAMTINACQPGATWMLKHSLETGQPIKPKQVSKILSQLNKVGSWQALLHLFQCLPYVAIPNSDKSIVASALREGIRNENKFVRAWAYNGFYHLASQHPEFTEESALQLKVAMKDKAASVKARIRNINRK